jgi:tetratricopeptide (TPR) repeat protein
MAEPAPHRRVAGRYVLERPFGAGSGATVWQARDEASGDTVAVKLVTAATLARVPGFAGALAAAADLGRRLTHPGIVRALDAGRDGDDEFLVMEAVTGGTLAALRGGPWRAIAVAVAQVAEALQFAHAVGVVHRDLKAANVLLDARGRARVADFAVASPGSPSNRSPAQLAGAPPAIADDLYGLGTLLFDLLSGAPPFHPDITPERVATELPPRLAVDGSGAPLPNELTQLVAALLSKDPARRPAGMGAVRAVLDDLLAADDRRQRPVPAPVAARPPPVADAGAARRRPLGTYAVLAVLAAVAIAAVLVLPGIVAERGPLLTAPAELPATPAATIPATPPADRVAADAARAAYAAEVEAAGQAGLPRFRPGVLAAAAARAAAGDSAYQGREFAAAAAAWTTAATELRTVRESIPTLLATALRLGDEAIAAGDAGRAAVAYAEALAIAPADAAAQRGVARAAQLPAVLAAMATGAARENAGDPAAARAAYREARTLDPDWAPAAAALARLDAGAAAAAYGEAMADGLAAAAAGRDADARAAFGRALGLRPGDAAASAALADLDRAAASRDLRALADEAAELAAAERWADAVGRYRALLARDASLATAQAGLATAESRAALDARLRATLAATDRLNEPARAAAATVLLAEARAVAAPGPGLAGQVAALAEALAIAARPVTVAFESDNLTRVTIFKVAELGTFASRTVTLKPGAYVVVGRRDGYRDVRRQIRVGADGLPAPVVVRCEEPI